MSMKTFDRLVKKSKEEEEKTKLAWERYNDKLKELYGDNPDLMEKLNYGEDLDESGNLVMKVGSELFGGNVMASFMNDIIADKAEETRKAVAGKFEEAGVGAGHPLARATSTKLRLLEKLAKRKAAAATRES